MTIHERLESLINEAHNPPIEGFVYPDVRLEDLDIDLFEFGINVQQTFDVDFSEEVWEECGTVKDVVKLITECLRNQRGN